MRRTGQAGVVGVLIVALLGSAGARYLCIEQRRALDAERGVPTGGTANVSKLDSFALGLLLGGLRGPLLMALWTSSENQKSERNLDDFDTKVDLIRLLQAEFDAVHLFQIWNKAFNISVQMANVPTKYTVILDAMDYAYSVNDERPDNINIISAIGGLYFDKFGNAAERGYFAPRLMDETLPVEDRVRVSFPANLRETVLHEARMAGAPPYVLSPRQDPDDASRLYVMLRKTAGDALKQRITDPSVTYAERPVNPVDLDEMKQLAGRRVQHETLLDKDGNILPQYLEPRAGRAATGDALDGSRLPYLKRFEPFPYGVSPFALAYNYQKRAQWLLHEREAQHLQMSNRVISSRPALALKKWAEEDTTLGRRAEMELFSLPYERDGEKLDLPAAEIPLTRQVDVCPLYHETVWRYNNAARVAADAVQEYEYHLQKVPEDEFSPYRSHIAAALAQRQQMLGDALYLQAMAASGAQRQQLAGQADQHYAQAINLYARLLLGYFTEMQLASQVLSDPQLTRVGLNQRLEIMNKMPDEQVRAGFNTLRSMYQAGQLPSEGQSEFVDFATKIRRAEIRRGLIADAIKPAGSV